MRALRALLVVGVLSATVPAAAQAPTANATAAQALFDEAKALMKAGHYDQACPKLEESQRLDPGGGTLVALALCYEAQGKVASAWSEWNLALSDARSGHRADREKLALEHIKTLEPRLPRMRLVVDPANAGVEVRRDGTPVDGALWGTALPVDPGEHRLEARAPGKKAWQSVVTVRPEPSTLDVAVPRLEDEPAPPPPVTPQPAAPPVASAPPPPAPAVTAEPAPAPPAPAPSSASSLRPWSYVLGGVGIVGLGVATGFALSASSKWSDAHGQCPGNHCTSPSAVSEGSSAGSAADVASVLFVGGGACLAGGVVMFLLSGSGASSSTGAVHVTPIVGTMNGLAVGGTL